MAREVKHLYIHIPFCKSICTYCDFCRCIGSPDDHVKYVEKIIKSIKSYSGIFSTIYIGGGTPNCLQNNLLEQLLRSLEKNIGPKTEFTIECNPEFITQEQITIFKSCGINRVSLGVQTTNDGILKKLNRKHTMLGAKFAVKVLQLNGIKNISVDFIYGFNKLSATDILDMAYFIRDYKIPHVSCYSLEIKSGSQLAKDKYEIDEFNIERQLKRIIMLLKKVGLKRYEVSNWSKGKKYQSKHNLAYWNSNDWIGLGFGAFGFEKKNYYENVGRPSSWEKNNIEYTDAEYYQHILLMGLRTVDGLNLRLKHHRDAFNFFANRLPKKKMTITKKQVKVKNVNLLNDILLEIV